jgi:hypothetical protein
MRLLLLLFGAGYSSISCKNVARRCVITSRFDDASEFTKHGRVGRQDRRQDLY